MVHVCENHDGIFLCKECSFSGPLEKAVEHIIEKQFIVKEKPIEARKTQATRPQLGFRGR